VVGFTGAFVDFFVVVGFGLGLDRVRPMVFFGGVRFPHDT
jgi:hypothetical protein